MGPECEDIENARGNWSEHKVEHRVTVQSVLMAATNHLVTAQGRREGLPSSNEWGHLAMG